MFVLQPLSVRTMTVSRCEDAQKSTKRSSFLSGPFQRETGSRLVDSVEKRMEVLVLVRMPRAESASCVQDIEYAIGVSHIPVKYTACD